MSLIIVKVFRDADGGLLIGMRSAADANPEHVRVIAAELLSCATALPDVRTTDNAGYPPGCPARRSGGVAPTQ
jgi:hypothetical protein